MTRRRIGPAYQGPKSHKALAERLLNQCVMHLRGSFRRRPKQEEEFFFEGPYFQGSPNTPQERATYIIHHNPSGGRAVVDVYSDLHVTVETNAKFPEKALRCTDAAFNSLLEQRWTRVSG